MYCPNCGKGNPEGARFCMHSGLELNEYKVEISPKIEISPNIIVQMMDKGRINSLVTGKANKILENTISLKCIQKEKAKFSPEEILALNSVMQIAKELEEELDEKGKVDLSIMYSHQNLESFVEFLDGIPDDCYEEVNTYEALINLKGAILRVLNRYDEAIHCFDKVLEKNPKSVFALVEKGRTIWWSSAGPFTEHCDKLFKGLCTKGEIEDLRQKRDLINKEARKCFDKALEIYPLHELAWFYKSVTVSPAEGIKCIDKALEINPRIAEAWLNKAIYSYTHVSISEEYVDFPDLTIKMEKRSEYKSKLWEAVEYCDTALRIEPNYTEALKEKEEILAEIRRLS